MGIERGLAPCWVVDPMRCHAKIGQLPLNPIHEGEVAVTANSWKRHKGFEDLARG